MDPDQTALVRSLIRVQVFYLAYMIKSTIEYTCTLIYIYAPDIKSRQLFQDKNLLAG